MQAERLVAVAKVDARRGADVLLEILECEGVQYIFGNPGTTELPFMDAHFALPLQHHAEITALDIGYAETA